MTRPLRLELPGALYHVTSRGDRRGAIFLDECDREAWLEVLGAVCVRCHLVVHAYCQMTNHYHLMVETVEGNLGQGMQQLNGIYTQQVNRRHGLVGHVLQGRYKAILVQKESYLLTLARYIVLNPVRAGMVGSPGDWPWSSHGFTIGEHANPEWLAVDSLLNSFASSRDEAISRYKQFVLEGIGAESPLNEVKHQLVLGDDQFTASHSGKRAASKLAAVVKVQRRMSVLTLDEYRANFGERDEAIARAYWTTAFTMAATVAPRCWQKGSWCANLNYPTASTGPYATAMFRWAGVPNQLSNATTLPGAVIRINSLAMGQGAGRAAQGIVKSSGDD